MRKQNLFHPHILSGTINPSFQGSDTLTPSFQSFLHTFHALLIKNSTLHPRYPHNLLNLIDCSTNQSQGQSFHNQILNLIDRKSSLLSNEIKRQRSTMWRPREYK